MTFIKRIGIVSVGFDNTIHTAVQIAEPHVLETEPATSCTGIVIMYIRLPCTKFEEPF